ncbi:MAG: PA14 domain-containing protein [Bacteroidota bacterium]
MGVGIAASLLLAFAPLFLPPPSGLSQTPAVGPFLNNLLPSTTPSLSTGPLSLQVIDAFPTLSFDLPLHMAQEPTTNRMLVGEFAGRIQAFDLTAANPSKSVFLDLTTSIWLSGESGLLSFAFHPAYPDSNYIYVFYQFDGGYPNYSRVSRFTIPTIGGPADPASELVLIQQADEDANHNGGMLLFGNDGFLYIGMGDEGGRDDEYNNAQIINQRLFSGILRIDVDQNANTSHPIRRQPLPTSPNDQSFTANYMIPNSNPWQDVNGGLLEEFYAIGLRNPARLSLDHITGDIFIGEVGQEGREEINILAAGANYEWPFREGSLIGPKSPPAVHYGTDTGPAFEYAHSNGSNCVIGGIRYRGSALPNLAGQYVFADNGSSIIWSGIPSGNTIPASQLMQTNATSSTGLVAFGEDSNHNLYFINMGPLNIGKIYTFTNVSGPPGPQPPPLLSQLGIFSNLASLEPDSFTIPYDQNVPFWSDAALKSRYMIIPNDGNPNTAAEQIGYSAQNNWTFPFGTVFVKHFEMQIDDTDPSLLRRLETRLMVHGTDGNYYGLSYRWNDSQTDAELLEGNRVDTLSINTQNGPREVLWYYPNRTECLSCHRQTIGSVLGLKTAQLNGIISYPSTGITANQIKTLAHLDFFDQAPDTANLASLAAFPSLQDPTAPLEAKALAYLDANCAYCHNPNSGVFANFDARSIASNDLTSLIYGGVNQTLGLAGARAIVPADVEHSVLFQRMSSLRNGIAMPPLSKNEVDSSGLALLRDWINSLSPAFDATPATPSIGQTISFPSLPNVLTTQASLSLQATSSSGLPISYVLEEGPAILMGNTLAFTGDSGYVVIQATQDGNAAFDPAPSIRRKFFVAPPGHINGTGLTGEYYDNLNLTNLVGTRLDSQVNFYWNSYAPLSGMQYGHYSVRWRGQIEPPYSGSYTFSTLSDDGIRLWVNGQLLIDQWQNQALAEFSNTIVLNALQKVDIQIEYFEYRAYSEVELQWSHALIDKEIIPKEFLFPFSVPFPIDLLAFEAYSQGDRVVLEWITNPDRIAQNFVVEKAGEDLSFTEIDRVSYEAQISRYQSQDLHPRLGRNYYRIKQVDVDGGISYSDTREVMITQLLKDLQVQLYPNPIVYQRELNLDISTQSARPLILDFYQLDGKQVLSIPIYQASGKHQHKLDLRALGQGIYVLQIRDLELRQKMIKRVLLL